MSQSLSAKIEIPKDKLAEFCRRWEIAEFAFFGSVLRLIAIISAARPFSTRRR